jgi:predicted membrane chloride channel (bestrophin family)
MTRYRSNPFLNMISRTIFVFVLSIAMLLSLSSLSSALIIPKASTSIRSQSIQMLRRYASISEIPMSHPTPSINLDSNSNADVLLIPAANNHYDSNDHRYSASDWFHNIKTMSNSSILREIKNPILAITLWSTLVSVVQHILLQKGLIGMARGMCMSNKPHSLLVSALGLLLVFRTNSAYQRFAEGRLIWEKVLSTARNMSRMVALYETEIGTARKHRIFRLLAAYPYLLRHHIQPQCLGPDQCDAHLVVSTTSHALLLLREQGGRAVRGGGVLAARDCWVDRRTLPWCLFPSKALKQCAESSNRPLWVCDRLSHELASVEYTPNFTSRERLTFIGHIDKLSAAIGECERIHQTAVPLNYARHSLRSLTIWLFTLPFSILAETGLLTGAVMGIISWLMLGVYQIGYTIEDPFQGSLRLSILCDAIYRDVMYSGKELRNPRETAFSTVKEEMDEWAVIEGAEQKSSSLDVLLP